MTSHDINRRTFLKQAGLAGAGLWTDNCLAFGASPDANAQVVTLLYDPDDTVAAAAPAQWALGHLPDTLSARGVTPRVCRQMS